MRYDENTSFIFANPTRIVYGQGAAKEVALEARRLDMKRILLVSDQMLSQKTDCVEIVASNLGSLLCARFLDCPPDSGVDAVMAGYHVAKQFGVDGVVSVGGGSVIDTAKGIAILIKYGGHLKDYEGFQNLTGRVAPHIAIPTTAGTGSEVTYVAVIKDHQNQRKLLFGDYNIIPDTAILDPQLTLSLPPFLTGATGMDAISHAIEAMHSLQRQPIADGLALHALRLLKESIPVCINQPHNLVARGQQLIGACMAGAAFSNAQVGLVHAMAHTVGARFGVHHGLANSIFLPHVIRFNKDACQEVYQEIASVFDLDREGLDVAERLASKLSDFALKIGLPLTLREVGVPEDALETLAEMTLYDGALVYNPRTVFGAQEILPIWRSAWSGEWT